MPLTTVESAHNVPATVDRVIAALGRRGISVFARIDHAAGARKAGLELADEELLIFGDPRLLIWDASGQTMIGYRRPTELQKDFALANQLETLQRMEKLLEQITAESSRPDG